MFRARRRRASRRRSPGEEALDVREPSRERIGLVTGKPGEQLADPVAQQACRGAQDVVTVGRQSQFEAAAVGGNRFANDETVTLEFRDELGDRRAGDPGAGCELDGREPTRRNRPQRQELHDRDRRLMPRKEPLDPPGRERGRRDEGVGCVPGRWRFGSH